MKRKTNFLALLLYIVVTACTLKENNMIGVYTKSGNINLIDTITVNSNGYYDRVLYSKSKTLIFKNKATWSFKNDRIVFKDFLKDDDSIEYQKIKESFSIISSQKYKELLMDVSLPVEKVDNNIVIYLNQDLNILYQSIKKK